MSKIKKAMERHRASTRAVLEREKLENDIRELLSREHPEVLGTTKKKIQLAYTETKTIPTDPEILRSNRVYALRSDFEITTQFEMLRAQILRTLKQMNANTLLITSAYHKEGKTFISSNLAASIVRNMDRTVMLIDADLRKRSYVHHNMENIFFNSSRMPGLSDFLTGTARIQNILVNPGIPRLTILPSGKSILDSAASLGSPRMEALIQEMKSRYSKERIIILDSSSFMTNADPLVLARFVDAVLLVIEDERTEAEAIRQMTDLLKDSKIIGVVLNKAR